MSKENGTPTYEQVITITGALEALSKMNLPIWYEITKNLRLCSKAGKEFQKVRNEIWEKYGKKDKDGKWKTVKGKDSRGNEVDEIDFGKERDEALENLNKLLSDKPSIEFHKIPYDKVKGLSLSADMMEPLMDYIITEN